MNTATLHVRQSAVAKPITFRSSPSVGRTLSQFRGGNGPKVVFQNEMPGREHTLH